MKRNLSILIFVSATFIFSNFLLAAEVTPSQNGSCLKTLVAELQTPEKLNRDSSRAIEKYELLRTGKFATNAEELAFLADGNYLYCIDSHKRIVYSPRTLRESVSTDAQYLVTHRSLYSFITHTQSAEPDIIAAGEFRIINGRVSQVNNKSGTFKGNQTHLAFAVSFLKTVGLKIEANTDQKDAAEARGNYGHINEMMAAKFEILYRDTPEYREIMAFHKRLAALFPDPKTPGLYDLEKLLDLTLGAKNSFISKVKSASRLNREVYNRLNHAPYLIKWMQTEGFGYTVFRFIDEDEGSSLKLNDVIEAIEIILAKK